MHNGKHKRNECKQYKLLEATSNKYGDQRDIKNHYIDKFNFKKTTALKAMYSCTGYGGKCSMCKPNWNEGKMHSKRTIKYGKDGSKQLILNIKTTINF